MFDGVQVSLTKRNLYVCGRTHTLTPRTQSTRQRAVSAFRERLLIPDPHLRSVLKTLVLAGSEGVRCDEQTISLVRWLNTDSSDHDGGWALKPYVRLVCGIYGTTDRERTFRWSRRPQCGSTTPP